MKCWSAECRLSWETMDPSHPSQVETLDNALQCDSLWHFVTFCDILWHNTDWRHNTATALPVWPGLVTGCWREMLFNRIKLNISLSVGKYLESLFNINILKETNLFKVESKINHDISLCSTWCCFQKCSSTFLSKSELINRLFSKENL